MGGDGSLTDLHRASDGKLYFRYDLYSKKWFGCETIQLDSLEDIRPIERRKGVFRACGAVGRSNVVWAADELAVLELREGHEWRPIGPVAPVPCIGGEAFYYPYLIVANPSGDVWFVYGKLWHVDPSGRLSSIELPMPSADAREIGKKSKFVLAKSQFVLASDGTLWLSDGASLYHFIPSK